MCGFFVYYPVTKSDNFKRKKFFKSAELITHRGPDESKFFLNKNINMFFHRLSIVDLSKKGSQPMISQSKNNIIVFNGEIYNSNDLKRYFDKKNFRGKSDTEVVLNFYEKYGPDCLKYFKGMFSFVIYNFKEKSCFVARDRFGIKPLYYLQDKDYILFSSEIKPILFYHQNNLVNKKAFANFLIHQELESEETYFKNIRIIEPSTFKIFKQKNTISKKYWELIEKNPMELNINKVKENFNSLLDQAVRQHLISDRRVGISLSGGNDSEIITNQVKKFKDNIDTVTYEFENNNLNEGLKASNISKQYQFKNHKISINPKYIINNFQNIINELESPFTSIRLFGTRKLFNKFKSLKIPVVLEGSGGDEMLGGYDYNIISYFKDVSKNDLEFKNKLNNLSKIRNTSINDYLKTIKYQNFSTKDCSVFFESKNLNSDFYNKFFEKKNYFKSKKYNKINNMKKSQLIDINFVNLPRSLRYLDRLSMISGIEARPVLLDHELFKFCFNLDNKFKINKLKTRFLMRNLIKGEKQKREFLKKTITDPQRSYLSLSLNELFNDTFHSKKFRENDFFNYKNVIKNFNDKQKIKKNSFSYFQIFTSHLMMENFKLI